MWKGADLTDVLCGFEKDDWKPVVRRDAGKKLPRCSSTVHVVPYECIQ